MTQGTTTRASSRALWIAAILLALVFAGSLPPLADCLTEYWQVALQTAQARDAKLALQIAQETQDAHEARRLKHALPEAEVERLLAPVDRVALIAQMEPLAATARLARLTYTLAPAQVWDGGTAFPGIKGIVVSTLELEADAPSDTDIFAFLSNLKSLPGSFELMTLDIARIREGDEQPQALNLHMKASLRLYANSDEATK